MATTGDVRVVKEGENSIEVEQIARFAVDEHNKKENALLEFARVVKAKEQVVAGTLHHLTLEVIDAGKNKLVEAKVWVKPWLNFKELQEFKHTGDSTSSINPTDLDTKRDAANHAVKAIQQKCNFLAAYELREYLLAKTEVIENYATWNCFSEEEYKVEVRRRYF